MGSTSRVRLLLTAVAALAISVRLGATTIVVPSDASLAARAELIAAGRVVSSAAVERNGRIWTEATVAVDAVLKGTSAGLITIAEPGGTLGDRTTVVFGAPVFTPGERALLFLAPDGNAYRAIDLAAGKFTERADRSGTRFWVRDLRASGLRVLSSPASSLEPAFQREARGFENAIRSGTLDDRSYLVGFAESDGEVQAQFATTLEPKVHRWFAFDDGSAAEWQSVGAQGGYARGGVQELATALAAWTGCPGARIDYRYAGASDEPPAGTAVANARNEVFFGDPRDDIAGSWNGRDGVVAVGGFEAVASPRPWTSRFEADPAHPARAFDAWTIVEGDVVVQDGVSPSRGIASGALAEILAHELGHTLGLGHSVDPRALMYATFQSFGAYLRDDDRLAAQWLYPGAQPGAPAPGGLSAPSKLTVASATSDLVRLSWIDNASAEAFQTIYVKGPGGMFAKLRDVGPNVTVANVTGLAPGRTYAFQVTARTPLAESGGSNIAEASVPRPPLQAAFAVGPASGTAGITTFSFYDQSQGIIASRVWSFGDGEGSALANPTHVYRAAGSYEVQLTIRDDLGALSTVSRRVAVNAPPPLVPDFSWTPSSPVAGTGVRFIDRSAGAPTRWSWSFGDGSVSSERDPVKVFAQPGRYTVTLEVYSGFDSARIVREIDVEPSSTSTALLGGV
ncbi:MAG TPA: PKD domain-containing protein [Thermoanaerobaculia bacterium]